MRKRIFLLPLIAIGFGLQAQSIGNSPYAAFGIGEVKYDNSVETSAMGGINTAYIWDFNNSFNFKNPAANTNLELTSIRVQATNENQFFKTAYNTMDVTKHPTSLPNISILFSCFNSSHDFFLSSKLSISDLSSADISLQSLYKISNSIGGGELCFSIQKQANIGLKT